MLKVYHWVFPESIYYGTTKPGLNCLILAESLEEATDLAIESYYQNVTIKIGAVAWAHNPSRQDIIARRIAENIRKDLSAFPPRIIEGPVGFMFYPLTKDDA